MNRKYLRIFFATLMILMLSVSAVFAQYEIFTAANRGDVKMTAALLKRNPDLAKSRSKGGFTPVHLAAINGHYEIVRLLVEAGAGVNEKNLDGATALIKAVQGGHLAVVNLLIEAGADVNLKDEAGSNALFLAQMNNRPDIVSVLIKKADVNLRTAGGATPLHLAAVMNVKDVQLLLEKGALINVQDSRGWTPLHAAVSSSQIEIVRFLIAEGADQTITNKRGQNPHDLAHSKGYDDIGKLLD